MSFGIKKSDCRFYINKDERTVICVISDAKEAVINFIENLGLKDMYICTTYKVDKNHLMMPNTFIGKAVCSEDDEWDEEVGCNLAYARAKHKFYRSFFKRGQYYTDLIQKTFYDVCDEFNRVGEKVSAQMDKLYASIEEQTEKS